MGRKAITAKAPRRGPVTTSAQPVSNVKWVKRETLRANAYNPNQQAPPEFRLLRLSILEDGWTQPLVVRPDGEIVDGFHRWFVAADPAIAALTDGLVPVVELVSDPASQRMSTIRHNRARGTHGVVKMADIVVELADLGVTAQEIGDRLGMEFEEVRRLLDRGRIVEHAADPELHRVILRLAHTLAAAGPLFGQWSSSDVDAFSAAVGRALTK